MEDRFVGRLRLAIGLSVSHSNESSLVAQTAEIVCESTGVELPAVIKDDGPRDAEASDDVFPNEPSHFSSGYRSYGLSLYPFGEVVHRHKKILTLPRSLGERAEDIHSPCGKQQGADDWRHGGGGDLLDTGELLALVTGLCYCHGILP